LVTLERSFCNYCQEYGHYIWTCQYHQYQLVQHRLDQQGADEALRKRALALRDIDPEEYQGILRETEIKEAQRQQDQQREIPHGELIRNQRTLEDRAVSRMKWVEQGMLQERSRRTQEIASLQLKEVTEAEAITSLSLALQTNGKKYEVPPPPPLASQELPYHRRFTPGGCSRSNDQGHY
jgi:hypothetical protein